VLRKVDRLSCIRYASARYSVPTRLIGASVAVVVDHGAVCLVEPTTGMIVAEHELGAPGTASISDAHYDGPRPAPNRGPRPKTTIEKQFCDLGAGAQAFLVGAAAIVLEQRAVQRVWLPWSKPKLAARDASNVVNRLKAAGFPVAKTLESFDVAASSIQPHRPHPESD
jgi:hypothetical protein